MKFTEEQAIEALKQNPRVAYRMGLKLSEYTLYECLLQAKRALTITQLLDLTGIGERSTVQRQLDSLKMKGFVNAIRDPSHSNARLWFPGLSTKYCPLCYSTNLIHLSTQMKKQCGCCGHMLYWTKDEGQETYL